METISKLIVLVALGGMSPLWADRPATPAQGVFTAREREPIKPVPLEVSLDARKVNLGRLLFHEPKLSHNDTISCSNCHDLRKGGTDQRAFSIGMNSAVGSINAPTVFNSGSSFKQFWDGRAATLEEQLDGPVQCAEEMNSSWEEVVGKLRAAPTYAAGFKAIYGGVIHPKIIKDALAHFERSLITPNSRFDQFLRGDEAAITATEKEGYRKFKSYGCASCHQGVNVGGNMFETLGAMADYFADRGQVTRADYGRFNVTGKEEDRFVFKVPTLRNVGLTAPYLHDGSAKSLEAAVLVMGRYQLGQRLSPEDVGHLVMFLETLTGEYLGRPL